MSKTKAQREEQDRWDRVMAKEFENHTLRERTDIAMKVYEISRLGSDGKPSFCHKNILIFLANKIIVFGDTMLTRLPFGGEAMSAVSDNGYDLDWFASSLEPGYLCSKFRGSIRAPLVALQRAFSRLYHAEKGTQPKE
jgi:hypothetical protein